jgi:carboxynorspermidine decarboxylase
VLDEAALERNLAVIDRVRRESGAEIIVALKACAMWSIFPELARHSDGATASSSNEARLVFEEYGTPAHTYAPTYADTDFDEIVRLSSHITFNSVGQYARFGARAHEKGISCGLRINPGWSPVETDLYNPALPGSRLGIERLDALPAGIEGLHFHVLCESSSADLARVLTEVEERFGHLLPHIEWLNCGGGHLMTREGYDIELLIRTIRDLKARHPHLRIILEPGSAFTWRTGVLVSTIEDIVGSADGDIRTAMLDVSFACHMPDCLEMPYKPAIAGAHDTRSGEQGWRMGGCSCLAGDWMGDWCGNAHGGFGRADNPDGGLRIGDRVIFDDMIHYTMVKTTMFNGVRHPSIAILREASDGSRRLETIRQFTYSDYKTRMS